MTKRRIVGQCQQSDFVGIEHLSRVLGDSKTLDTSTLTSRQRFAFHFLTLTMKAGIPWSMLRLVREVLFWGDDDDVSAVEIKFLQDPSKRCEIEEFRMLWRMGGMTK